MSYLVCHVQKFKANDVKGAQIHNQRESQNSKNKDIHRERTALNYDLQNKSHINYNLRVKEIIKEGYSIDKEIRKDAVLLTSTLVTSDSEYFKKLLPKDQQDFFKYTYEFFKEKYGEKNIVSATVHMDETTPHMHLCSVPLTKDGRLSAKIIFNRKELLSLQNDLPKYIQSKGFDIQRGEIGSEKTHLDTQEFKKLKIVELEVKLEKTKEALENGFATVKDITTNISAIESVKKKKSLLGANITLKLDDYNKLVDMAKQGIYNSDKIRDLKKISESLEKDNLSGGLSIQVQHFFSECLIRCFPVETFSGTVI
jgi:hypothetical protein